MANVIECNQLNRVYQTYKKNRGFLNSIKGLWNREYIEKVALHPLNLQIEAGQIIGLVGANGAGKTTLLKLMSGLIHPSSGSVRVMGYSPSERDSKFLSNISILLGQKNQLWWDISPADSYDLLSAIYDLDLEQARERVQYLADILNCSNQLSTQLRRLSLGERMKMEIIGALLHKPKVLFLDEPTIGLDVVAQNSIREFLQVYVKEEKPTVILTSHYMDDIAKLADRLLLMESGKIVYDGSVMSFMQQTVKKQKLQCSFSEPLAQSIVLSSGHIVEAQSRFVEIDLDAQILPKVLNEVMSQTSVSDLKILESNFEDVIREFMQKANQRR